MSAHTNNDAAFLQALQTMTEVHGDEVSAISRLSVAFTEMATRITELEARVEALEAERPPL
jgi:uncharacterized small protein (DUF1192 family)